jgi:hypothetical protein
MERLAAKRRKGVLARMPKESTEDILVGLKKAELAAGGRKATQADVESVNEELEMYEEQDRLDARKPAGKLKDRPDIPLEKPAPPLNLPKTSGPSELKATTEEEHADLEKKYGSWEAAKEAIKAEGDRYRGSLQAPDAWKRDIDASRMAEFGDVGDVVGAKDSGFEEEYDATTKFQEEEYGGGSFEREMVLSEILGEDWRTERDPARREDLQPDGTFSFDGFLEKAKAANPEGREEDWQDAAIKEYYKAAASKASNAADKFDDVEDTAQASGQMVNYAEEKKATPVLSDDGKKRVVGGTGTTPKQPTAAQKAAALALQKERARAGVSDDFVGPIQPESISDEVIEADVDETATQESIEEEAAKTTKLAVRDSAANEALKSGFANVRMPGLRKQSSELYNSFDAAYRSMYPSQEEMSKYPGARGRLIKRQNALDTIKNKLFRTSPDQWGNRLYGAGMNLDDAIQVLENELPTATKEIKQMARRMRGFHILMDRYGEDAQLKGAFDLENLIRNTRLRGDKPLEESGEVLRPIRTEGSLDESPSEEIIAEAAAEGV